MAKKKVNKSVKKNVKATVKTSGKVCSTGDCCHCKAIAAIAIVVFAWVSSDVWSKVLITILAALILIGAGGCMCKKMKK